MNKNYNLYSKKDIAKLNLKRDKQILQPLLWNLEDEEKIPLNKLKNTTNLHIDFSKSFLISSNKQIYKTYSIIGLTNYHTRNTKFYILDLALFLDIWYNNSLDINKDELINPDILIIHGLADPMNSDYKATALIELASIRKTKQKITWLFIEGTTIEEFEKLYPNVTKSFGKVYHSEF